LKILRGFCEPIILHVFAIYIFAKKAKIRKIAKFNLVKIDPLGLNGK